MPRSVPLLDACADPKLLGLELWPAQREAAAALDDAARMVVCAWGRRGGKTTLAAAVALHDCLLRPELGAMVRPGERRYAVVVATSREQARVTIDAARSIVERSPLLAELVESATEDELRFTTGTAFRAIPCSARSVRGYPVSTLIFDEAAHFVTTEDGYQTAERVWQALAPATAQFGESARILVTSTPYGTSGLFADLFSQAQDGDLGGALAMHATTAEANPEVSSAFLAAEERRDPDAYRVEYLAEFTGSGDAYLDPERYSAAARGPLEPGACEEWVAGLDPAFSSDPFGLAIVGRAPERLGWWRLGLVDALRPPRGEGGFSETMTRIIEELRRYGVRRVLTDQFSSAAIIDRLREEGFDPQLVTMSAASKTAAFAELRTALYTGELEVYEHKPLLAELSRLRTRYQAGSAGVTNPRVGGSHGDQAQALALVAWHIGKHRGPQMAESWNYRAARSAARNPTIVRGEMILTGSRYFDADPGGSGEVNAPPGWTETDQ